MTQSLPPMPEMPEPDGYADKNALAWSVNPKAQAINPLKAPVVPKEDALLESGEWQDADVPVFRTNAMHSYARSYAALVLQAAAKEAERHVDKEWPNDDLSAQARGIASAIRSLADQLREK